MLEDVAEGSLQVQRVFDFEHRRYDDSWYTRFEPRLVDLASRIPARLKHGSGGGKELLRKAMAPLLPEDIVEKRKQGFSPPDQSWYAGPTMDYIREILLDPRSLGRGYFQPAYVQRVLEEHLEGRVNHRLLIWSLLCFEWWNRLFMDDDAAALAGTRSSAARAT